MFMEIGEPEPPPIAEGAYWAFMPVAILLAIPGVVRALAFVVQQELSASVASVLDQYETLLVTLLSMLHEAGRHYLPSIGHDWALGPVASWLVFSFAGGTFIASWIVAGLQRATGFVGGSLAALLLALGLGVTLLGLGFLIIAYLFVSDGAVLIQALEKENDRAILIPLLVPPTLAGMLLAASGLA